MKKLFSIFILSFIFISCKQYIEYGGIKIPIDAEEIDLQNKIIESVGIATQLKDIEKFSKLKKLNLDRNYHFGDIANFALLVNLRELNLNRTCVSDDDIVALENLNNLEILFVSNRELENIDRLPKNLKFLTISNHVSKESIKRYRKKNPKCKIKFVQLFGNFDDISMPIDAEKLDYHGQNITHIRGIKKFTNLKELFLFNNPIRDINEIRYLRNLIDLDIAGTKVNNIDQVKYLKNLKILDVSSTNIKDISPLIGLNNLENLAISGTEIYNIDQIRFLKNLKKLYARHINLKDVSFLSELNNLEVLSIENTQVKEIDKLPKNLKELRIGKSVNKESIEKYKRENPDCNVRIMVED
ncbi:MAG TPA: leucine-rich repeat domain-containing protein [Leptospiraceae bacterium]|nr:leucine-rich repeat domain-containing protein [Leptospiraceae bacterium]